MPWLMPAAVPVIDWLWMQNALPQIRFDRA
jgi:hypothetical protein